MEGEGAVVRDWEKEFTAVSRGNWRYGFEEMKWENDRQKRGSKVRRKKDCFCNG